MPNEIYEQLAEASHTDLIRATIRGYSCLPGISPEFIAGLELALKLVGASGWLYVAPDWLNAVKHD